MRRRWYLVVATLVLAVAGTLLTVTLVGTTYRAEGAVLLVPPGASLEQRPGTTSSAGNPYLQLTGLTEARDIVIRSMSAKSTYIELCETSGDPGYESMRRNLCSAHPSISFEVAKDDESNAPVILVTVDAASRQDAITTLNTVMNRVPTTLQQLQSDLNLRANAAITSAPVVADTIPDVVHKDQIRAAVLVGGGTFALGLLVTGMVDGLFLPRRRAALPDLDTDEELDEAPEDEHADPPSDGVDDGQGAGDRGRPGGEKPSRKRSRPGKQTSVPDWGQSAEQELTGVGADRSAPRWD
ncbi:hypothetical protein [Microlunatus spumicola]|uniref:hypothetical protein n=1 Tax=Microlunatus spumicola TaxID=81499 RepID=UPI00195C414A